MTTYYLTSPLYKGSNLYVANGETVEAEVRPAKSSRWPPPSVNEDQVVYLVEHDEVPDEGLWRVSKDLTKMSLADRKAMANRDNAAKFANATAVYDAKYPKEEQATWGVQLAAAQDYQKNGVVSVLLQALADASGKKVADLAQSIIDNDSERQQAQATLLSDYVKAKTQIAAAKSVSELPEPNVQDI